jgi:short subunit dehydrogenase-like uncharacterized protein
MAQGGAAVALFGATGYTGRLIARELHRRGIAVLLAGRDAARLAALAAALDGPATAVATVGDRASLDALARRAPVLINCVGPFVDLGEPVVRAAIAAGTHYVDTTGEQPFLRAMLVHDTWAKTQQVAVVPALAFEIALADCAAAIGAAELDAVERVRVTYVTRFHASLGTKRTALRMLQADAYAYVDGDWVVEPPARRSAFVPVPHLGTVAAVSIPSGEVITVPRHVRTREVRTYLRLPVVAARLLSSTAPLIPALARSPLAQVAGWALGERTEGPDEDTRRRDVFHVIVDLWGVRRGKDAGQRVLVRGRDPYGVTAAICRLGVESLLAGSPRATGVLSPAMAFDPRRFLAALASDGVAYELAPLSEGAPAVAS